MAKGKGNTGNQHVVPRNGDWTIRGVGNERRTGTFDTQKEAIDRAREIAGNKGTEVVIHRPDGTIRDKDSHGNDPYPPKG
jgi:Uncharacterized protein conserved in bacteria (DUF2188)